MGCFIAAALCPQAHDVDEQALSLYHFQPDAPGPQVGRAGRWRRCGKDRGLLRMECWNRACRFAPHMLAPCWQPVIPPLPTSCRAGSSPATTLRWRRFWPLMLSRWRRTARPLPARASTSWRWRCARCVASQAGAALLPWFDDTLNKCRAQCPAASLVPRRGVTAATATMSP